MKAPFFLALPFITVVGIGFVIVMHCLWFIAYVWELLTHEDKEMSEDVRQSIIHAGFMPMVTHDPTAASFSCPTCRRVYHWSNCLP